MKFEDIIVGEDYLVNETVEKVRHKFTSSKEKCVLTVCKKGYHYIYSDFSDFKPLAPKLPETGLVVSKYGGVVMKTGENSGYGFHYNGEYFMKTQPFDDVWRPATKADEKRWKELLIEEAKRRGYKEGVKTKEGVCGETFFQNYSDSLSVCTQGSKVIGFAIMSKGKWAEIIEEPKKEHFKDAEPYLIARDHFSKKLNEVYEEISKKWVHKSMLVTPYPTWKMSDEIDKNNSEEISTLDLERSLRNAKLEILKLELKILKRKNK